MVVVREEVMTKTGVGDREAVGGGQDEEDEVQKRKKVTIMMMTMVTLLGIGNFTFQMTMIEVIGNLISRFS